MNTFVTFLGGSFVAIANLCAQSPDINVRLLGTAASGLEQLAVLEFRNGNKSEVTLLRPGERIYEIEITAIDAAHGTVHALLGTPGTGKTLEVPVPFRLSKDPKLNLRGVDASTALAVLAEAFHLTVLAREEGSSCRTNYFAAEDADQNAVFNVLANGLAGCGITVIRDGEPFVFAIPTAVARTFSFSSAPKKESQNGVVSKVPAGMIRFIRMETATVCAFYGDLAGRSLVLPSPKCFPTRISVRNMTDLTRAQATWMLESLFQLNDLAVIPIGTNITIVAPFTQTNMLPRSIEQPTERNAAIYPSTLKLQTANAKQLLELYCDVTGGMVGRAAAAGSFQLIARKPMTRREVKYALEVVAAFQGLTFQVNSDGKTDLIAGNESKLPE